MKTTFNMYNQRPQRIKSFRDFASRPLAGFGEITIRKMIYHSKEFLISTIDKIIIMITNQR